MDGSARSHHPAPSVLQVRTIAKILALRIMRDQTLLKRLSRWCILCLKTIRLSRVCSPFKDKSCLFFGRMRRKRRLSLWAELATPERSSKIPPKSLSGGFRRLTVNFCDLGNITRVRQTDPIGDAFDARSSRFHLDDFACAGLCDPLGSPFPWPTASQA